MAWEDAHKVIADLGHSTNPDYWMKLFHENPDALYSILSDIYYISEYRKTGERRKKDGMGSLEDLWKLLGEVT